MPSIDGTPGNDILYGTGEADVIAGGEGDDKLFGFDGDDSLDGGDGSDMLDGGTGADSMSGGLGDDYYYVDNQGDVVIEGASAGIDLVFTTIDYTLASNVERVAVLDQGSTFAINLTGNSLNNVLTGNDGPNLLIGGTGYDIFYGRGGDDTYVTESPTEIVNESAGGGFDAIYVQLVTSTAAHLAFDYSLMTEERRWGLLGRSHVEQLGVYDPTTVNSVNLEGSPADNGLYGNDGINMLDGYFGNDLMVGYGGNDLYYVDQEGDSVVEHAGGGFDTILLGHANFRVSSLTSPVSYVLPDNVERLAVARADSSAAHNLAGNALDNELSGNNGANTLDGGGGRDILIGYGGADTYVFSSAPGPADADQVVGFQIGADTIALDHDAFAGLQPGSLSPDVFQRGTTVWQAQDADDRILYDASTGNLYFDPDGIGATEPLLFATLHEGLDLTASDFIVI